MKIFKQISLILSLVLLSGLFVGFGFGSDYTVCRGTAEAEHGSCIREELLPEDECDENLFDELKDCGCDEGESYNGADVCCVDDSYITKENEPRGQDVCTMKYLECYTDVDRDEHTSVGVSYSDCVSHCEKPRDTVTVCEGYGDNYIPDPDDTYCCIEDGAGSPTGGESCPESILSDSYDVDDDNCCISLDICQDYVEGGVCEIPVAEGSDEMVEVDLCKEPGTCVSPLTDDGIGGCCVMYESWDDCENFSDFVDVNSATGAKDEECYLCPDGTTLDGIECNDGEGEMEELEHVKWCVSSSTEPSTICSKSRLIQGQSCCDGYKKIKDGSTYTCKPCGKDGVCCGIALNTVVPFIGDCIQFQKSASDPNTTVVGPTTAFPKLMQGLSKLMVTAILVFSFVLLIVAGVMMTASGGSDANYNKGKELIGKVVIGIALLGASGVILKLINPNFFG